MNESLTRNVRPGKTIHLGDQRIDIVSVRGNDVEMEFHGFEHHIRVVSTASESDNQKEEKQSG